MMTVTYENKNKDLFWFLLHVNTRAREIIILAVPALIVAACVGFSTYWLLEERTFVSIVILTIVFLFITPFLLVGIFLINIGIAFLLMISKSNKSVLCEHTITINEDKLTEETKFNRTEHYWDGFGAIKKTRNYVYLFIGRYYAHIIPVEAFNNPVQADEFVGFCKRMVDQRS
jgi:hypothetical protein